MNDTQKTLTESVDMGPAGREAERPGTAASLARRAFMARLHDLARGRLTISDAWGQASFGRATAAFPLSPAVFVRDPGTYLDIILGGALGAAEAYVAGKWTTSDLTAVIRIFAANQHVFAALDSGLARASRPFLRFGHWCRRNSRRRSRENIGAHYDLGNELFELFLDPTMMYSSAVYPREDSTLDEAAVHKLDLICRKLALGPGDHLLEIGTGWGGLAMHAASRFGCRVTTTTISQNQLELARRRVRDAGLEDRVTLLDRDYRELEGQFDKLVSVEMIEAVGPQYLDTFFQVCSDRLKPDGRMLIQAITMADRNYRRHLASVDFIKKYIFPGGALPSMSALADSVARATDLQLVHLQDIGFDYARTLQEWCRRFMARLDEVRDLGYPDEFIRMWQYYLCYCEGGFLERAISDVQLVFDKPLCRLPPQPAAGG
jgi:cyclopropane-fatty-acyl-phospholipid synthase